MPIEGEIDTPDQDEDGIAPDLSWGEEWWPLSWDSVIGIETRDEYEPVSEGEVPAP